MPQIIVVDDNEAMRNFLREALTDAGHEVRCACDGKEALRFYLEQTPDIVITDLIMPTQEGLETIIQMRRLNPAVKIIAISGGGHIPAKDYLTLAEKCGASHTMTKPFTPPEILAAIRSVLNKP